MLFLITTFLQIVEEPLIIKDKAISDTNIYLSFSSPKVTVKEEIWSYPLASFVADCGGLLGLFVGFNFLMIVDTFGPLYEKINRLIRFYKS